MVGHTIISFEFKKHRGQDVKCHDLKVEQQKNADPLDMV